LRSAFAEDAVLDRDTPIERCEQILTRTTDRMRVTDDNMGTEWRYFWGRE